MTDSILSALLVCAGLDLVPEPSRVNQLDSGLW